MLKRRAPPGMDHMGQQRIMGMPPQQLLQNGQGPPPGAQMYPGGPMGPQPLRLLPNQMQPHPTQLLIPHPGTMIPISSSSGQTAPSNLLVENVATNMTHLNQSAQQFMPQSPYLMTPTFTTQTYFDDSAPLADPFVPPSYAPEMKNAVVLQPL